MRRAAVFIALSIAIYAMLPIFMPSLANSTVLVNDLQHVLSGNELASLQSTSSNHRVVITFTDSVSQIDLDGMMSRCITTPNTVCIGIDTKKHYSRSHFGIDTGIKSGDFQQVSLAGNMDFKEGRWADGAKSIISRANIMSQRTNTGATAVVIQQPIVEKSFPKWPFFVGFSFLALVLGIILWRIRKREREAMNAIGDVRREAGELASRNIEAEQRNDFDKRLREVTGPTREIGTVTGRTASTPNFSNKPKPAPAPKPRPSYHPPKHRRIPTPLPRPKTPAPIVVAAPSSGAGDFVTGMMVGEAMSHHHRTPTPAPTYHRRRTPTPDPSIFSSSDSGGEGGSDSSWDSGGGGGSWDSGGGGGGDSGGGGGDF
jgi:uncharacterized membrane protein YgcG